MAYEYLMGSANSSTSRSFFKSERAQQTTVIGRKLSDSIAYNDKPFVGTGTRTRKKSTASNPGIYSPFKIFQTAMSRRNSQRTSFSNTKKDKNCDPIDLSDPWMDKQDNFYSAMRQSSGTSISWDDAPDDENKNQNGLNNVIEHHPICDFNEVEEQELEILNELNEELIRELSDLEKKQKKRQDANKQNRNVDTNGKHNQSTKEQVLMGQDASSEKRGDDISYEEMLTIIERGAPSFSTRNLSNKEQDMDYNDAEKALLTAIEKEFGFPSR